MARAKAKAKAKARRARCVYFITNAASRDVSVFFLSFNCGLVYM